MTGSTNSPLNYRGVFHDAFTNELLDEVAKVMLLGFHITENEDFSALLKITDREQINKYLQDNGIATDLPDRLEKIYLENAEAIQEKVPIQTEQPFNPNAHTLSKLFSLSNVFIRYFSASIKEKYGKDSLDELEFDEIRSKRITKTEYPVDNPNSIIWALGNTDIEIDPDGKLSIEIPVEKRGSNKEISIIYNINFEALENVKITKKLEPYDKLVYIAINALYNAGQDTMSAKMIYNAMGKQGNPPSEEIEKINDSITKMNGAHIYIDNSQEVEAKYKYPHFKYDASLLPMERKTVYVNGQLCETAVHIFREPPLISFAKDRNQITTIPIKLLQAPLKKTDQNIQIEDYLIRRIAHAKSGRQPKKILYSTIFDNAGITEPKQRLRAKEKIKKYLDYYISCEHIKAYKEEKDGVIISF